MNFGKSDIRSRHSRIKFGNGHMRHQASGDIGVFLAVCQAGSFAAAAGNLALSPSAVAKGVARLEQRLQVRLFHRTTRRLSLTQEGAIYRDTCRDAWQDIARVEGTLAALATQPAGLVRVSLPPLMGARIIAPALYALCDRWPDLAFDMAVSTQASDLLGDGVDLAVRIGHLPDLSGIMARHLGWQEVMLCAAPEYAARHGLPDGIEQLADHVLIANGRGGMVLPWQCRNEAGDLVSFSPRARLVLDGSLLTLSAIRAGQGIGLLPSWLACEDVEQGALTPLMADRIAGHLPVHALWVSSPRMVPRLRVSIDAVSEVVTKALSHRRSGRS